MSEIQETEKRVVKCVREGSFWYTTRKRICAYVFRIKRCFRSLDSPSQSFDHRIRQLPIHYIIGRIKGVSLSIYLSLSFSCYFASMQILYSCYATKDGHHMIKGLIHCIGWCIWLYRVVWEPIPSWFATTGQFKQLGIVTQDLPCLSRLSSTATPFPSSSFTLFIFPQKSLSPILSNVICS